MKLTTQKRIAAQLLKAGETKVWFDSDRLEDVKKAITKSDIRRLIGEGIVGLKRVNEKSRAGVRRLLKQKRKGRRQGKGSRKGKRTARLSRKRMWINRIRIQREFLKAVKKNDLVNNDVYRRVYNMVGGGFFRSRRHIKMYMEEYNIFKKK